MKIKKISEDFDNSQSVLSEVDDELNNIMKRFHNTGFKWEFKYRVEENGLHIYFFDTDYEEADKIIPLMNALNNMVLNLSRSFDISEFAIMLLPEEFHWNKISNNPINLQIDGRLILK